MVIKTHYCITMLGSYQDHMVILYDTIRTKSGFLTTIKRDYSI